MSHMYPDHYLEHYADRYMELAMRRRGVTLLQYLAAPSACERAAEEFERRGIKPEPLVMPQRISVIQARQEAEAAAGLAALERGEDLPADALRAIETEAERGLEHCPRRDGRIIEPLHHHSFDHNGHPAARSK